MIITTEGRDEDRKQGLALGAHDYIPKPVQTPHLLNVVRGILGS